MSVLTCVLAIAIATSPQTSIETVAEDLRSTGAVVTVANEPGGKEIWFEFRGPCTDKQLSKLHDLKKLTVIRLLDGGFTDEGILQLKNLPNLAVLVIKSDKLTDRSTTGVSKLASLRKLDFMDATLTVKGLKRLTLLTKLEQLYLHFAKVDTEDLAPLRTMRHLKTLSLPVHAAGVVDSFQLSLPNTKILCFPR